MQRIGIVGAGWIADAHARGWEDARVRADVVAVADIDVSAATKLAARFGAQVHQSYQDLLDRGDLDAVDICLPPHLHVDAVGAAARKGLHILCEKPIARDLAEADAIASAVSDAGIVYMPAHNSVFYPTVQHARVYLRRGDLGRVFLLRSWDCASDIGPSRLGIPSKVTAERPGESWRGSPALLGGGALIDGGFHAVYRLLFLSDSRVAEVSAMSGRFHPELGWPSEDTAMLMLGFDDGSLGEVVISYAFDAPTTGKDRLFAAAGEDGVLSGSEAQLQFLPRTWDEPARQELSPLEFEAAWFDTFRLEIAHFLDVLEGTAEPMQTLDDARRSLAVVRAAYESIETRQTVQLTPPA